MEIVLPLLAYVGVLTGILWAVARRGANAPIEPNPPRERPGRVYTLGDQVLAAAAQRHGLKHDVDVASGRAGELRLELAAVPEGTNPTDFTGVARFPRSLELELEVEQRGTFGGRGGAPIVSEEFDHDFKVDALHADQARALLEGDLGRSLLDATARGYRVELDDRELRLSVDARVGAERATEAISWLVRTAEAIVLARSRLKRPALEQQVLDAFATLAQAQGGRIDGDVLRLDLEEGELSAHVDRVSGRRFRTWLMLTFAKPLPLDLRLGLESERSRFARFRHKDIQLGDPSFDETFVVLGEPEDDVHAALDEPMRERLLTLAEAVVALSLTPTEIEVGLDGALGDETALSDIVDALREITRALAPRKAQGAYR